MPINDPKETLQSPVGKLSNALVIDKPKGLQPHDDPNKKLDFLRLFRVPVKPDAYSSVSS
jgi:hypothetical protein